jgi:hypothetical protein
MEGPREYIEEGRALALSGDSLPVKSWDWQPALSSNILIGVAYLTNKNANIKMSAGSGTYRRISCSYAAAIYFCNDVRLRSSAVKLNLSILELKRNQHFFRLPRWFRKGSCGKVLV